MTTQTKVYRVELVYEVHRSVEVIGEIASWQEAVSSAIVEDTKLHDYLITPEIIAVRKLLSKSPKVLVKSVTDVTFNEEE